MKTAIKAFLLVTAMATASRVVSQSHGPAFEVTGSLEHLVAHDGSFTNETSKFKMVIAGDQWQIRNFGDEGSYIETTYDGNSIFHFNNTNTLSFDARFNGIPPQCYWVNVEPGPVPSGGYPVELPWLAYASSTIGKSNLDDMPAPWLDPRYYPRAHSYESKIGWSTNSPGLPQTIRFIVSQARAGTASTNPWLNFEDYKIDRQWKPGQPYGFVGASYQVLAVTNIHGQTLPVSFELVTYRQSARSPISAIYRGTNIVITEAAPKTIQLTSNDLPIYVRDFRFQNRELNISYIDYAAHDWIVSASSEDLQELYRNKEAYHKSPLTYIAVKAKKPVLFYVFFAVVFFSPLIFIVMHKIRRRS